MTDLAAFLLARETEREQEADEIHKYGCASIGAMPFPCDCGEPARVLADCAARRQIIELHTGEHVCSYVDREWGRQSGVMRLCDTLRALPQPPRSHPDFDPAWAVGEESK